MKIIKLFNSIVLPNSFIYLRKEKARGLDNSYIEIDDEVVIILSKGNTQNDISKDTFYNYGVTGKVIGEENGIVIIETFNRIELDYIEDLGNNKYEIKITSKETIHDITDEEENNKLTKLKSELVSLVEKYEWGIFARTYIMQWHNLNEIIGAFKDLIILSPEEKYKLLEYDSDKIRADEIERIIELYMNTSILPKFMMKQKIKKKKIQRRFIGSML